MHAVARGPHFIRGGGTGPADPAAAGPKLNRNPQFKFFAVKHTDSFNKQ